MQLCFFEDNKFENFHPLTLSRPVDDLRIGLFTISEKWEKALQATNSTRLLRPYLEGVFSQGEIDSSHTCTWINSRYLPTEDLLNSITDLNEGQCLKFGNTVVAARVGGADSARWHKNNSPDFNKLFVLETTDYLSVQHLWDLFQLNGQQITTDVNLLPDEPPSTERISQDTIFQNRDNIYIGEGVSIEPRCVLDAEAGPIYLGDDVTIMAGSYIRGPAAVCEGSTVKMGAKIYEDTTIGPVCKIGGDIKNAIFHSYSNKAHEGFVGNSVIGQWCNLGAGTNTSNLKNDYSTVRIINWSDREIIETGQQFFGTIMADHCKTAINTRLNTGTLCGVSCNIFSADFPPRLIPSFSWVGSNVIQAYKTEKAFEAMEAMMARREVQLEEPYRKMLQHIYEERGPSL